MTETAILGFPEAARRLGVTVRVLRQAIRAGKIAPPPRVSATAVLPAEWLAGVQAAVKAQPTTFAQTFKQKVPAFARYEGTSAWHKHRQKVRAYAWFRAAAQQAA